MKNEFKKSLLESIKNVVEILALFFAGIYFMYQFFGSPDITNLDIELKTQRIITDKDSSFLSITVNLKKGDIGSIFLHDIKAFLYEQDSKSPIDFIDFRDFLKFKYKTQDNTLSLTDENTSEKYRIAANESTHFSAYKKVKADKIYTVVVAILGERTKLSPVYPQYQASTISFPVQEITKSN